MAHGIDEADVSAQRSAGTGLVQFAAEASKGSAFSGFSPCFLLVPQVAGARSYPRIVSAQKGLFSRWQAQINHVDTWVCIIELFARSQALFPRSNRFPMSGVEEASTLQTHNTPCS